MLLNVYESIRPVAAQASLPQIDAMFEGLSPLELKSLRSVKVERRVCERETQLVRANVTMPSLLLIQSGWAFRYRLLTDGRRQILSILLPGDTAGLDRMLGGVAGSAIQSATAVRYLSFDREHVARLLAEEPWFRQRALERLMEDRALNDTAVARLGQGSAEERIVSVLLELHDRLARQNLVSNGSFTLGLTQQHLSDLVGLTPVHLGRVLQRLRARKLLAVNGREVTLIDIPALERLAPF
jgi:CRP-like cAMP-binding protein